MTTGSQAYQKSVNLSLIMRALRHHPGISRTEIAAQTGLTKSTVTNLVRELRERDLVQETHPEQRPNGTSGGRPRVGLHVAAGRHRIAGIELRPEGFDAVIHDLAGGTLDTYRGFQPGRRLTLRAAFGQALDAVSADHPTLTGMGVALPATVDPLRGVILDSASFGIDETAFRDVADVPADLPILLENDANAVAWGAVGSESARPVGDLLAVVARLGEPDRRPIRVGTGLVVNGRVYHGSDFSAGEFHSAAWRRGDPGEVSGASQGELRRALRELLESLGVAVSMLRPRRLVYAGDLVERGELIASLLREELAGSFIDPHVSGCPLEAAGEGALAVASGASAMFRERLFAVPTVDTPQPRELPRWERMGITTGAGVNLRKSEVAG